MSGIHQAASSDTPKRWSWEQVTVASGSEPSGNRRYPLFLSSGDYLILTGGTNSSSIIESDLWVFDTSARTWSNNDTSFSPAGNITHGFGYDSTNFYVTTSSYGMSGTGAFESANKATIATGATSSVFSDIARITAATCRPTYDLETDQYFWTTVNSGNYDIGSGSVYVSTFTNPTNNIVVTKSDTQITGTYWGSGMAYYPAGDTLYALASIRTDHDTAWNIDADSIHKFVVGSGTGWTKETGVTNNAGTVAMAVSPTYPQLVWDPYSELFLIFNFNANGFPTEVMSYDPVDKVINLIETNGTATDYLCEAEDGYESARPRGTAGTVAVRDDGIYFIRTRKNAGGSYTNAEIWRMKRRF